MNFIEALLFAHHQILLRNPKSFILGLGVNYPNGADGSTKGLGQEFPDRVLDTPTSELAITGAAVGMASQGLRPIVHHGRVEFAMLAFDQIFTQASRWNFMFGGNYPCPVVLRICIGRQWGNGPQHTANYHSIFLQEPGLDIYIPATPKDAYRSLIASSVSENPAVILEHRWLYKTKEEFVPEKLSSFEFPFASVYGDGEDYTILTYADGLVDSLKALKFSSTYGIKGKVVCLKFFSGRNRFPNKLRELVGSMKNVILVDPAPYEFGLLSGVLTHFTVENILKDTDNINIICPPFHPCPTSPKLVGEYYPNASKIVQTIKSFGFDLPEFPLLSFDDLHLPPEMDYTTFNVQNLVGDNNIDKVKKEYYV